MPHHIDAVGLKDPVEVFCRIRALKRNEETSCVEILSDEVLQLNAPINQRGTQSRIEQVQCTFRKVFAESASQQEVFEEVGLPLIQDLLLGKNGLCFMYGVTGSGKTFTMNGKFHNGGILPNALVRIFNSINDLQNQKYIFKPDGYNNFVILNKNDAEEEAKEKQEDMEEVIKKVNGQNIPYVPEPISLQINGDHRYTIFVSFIEIYNNSVFDLLEEPSVDEFKQLKPPGSKILREDRKGDMFAYQTSEIEVGNADEAFALFTIGHQRRKTAHTLLNAESSRSHTVFTIKLVQVPLDPSGDEILNDPNHLKVSMLSLCDLAGSERSSRTNTGGEKARQAGHINNSLMTLRSCMETLRENQRNGTNKIISYRDSKLTHLFKNYFEGGGNVKMIVCVNPSTKDFDENLHVMKFANLTKEVKVTRAENFNFDTRLTPGKGKANSKSTKSNETESSTDGSQESSQPQQEFPPWPMIEVAGYKDCSTLLGVMNYLQDRIKQRQHLYADWQQRQIEVRKMILQLEQDNSDLTKALEKQRSLLHDREKEMRSNDKKIKGLNEKYDHLQRTVHSYENEKRSWGLELEKTKELVHQERQKKLKIKQTLKELTSNERLRWEQECQKRVHDKELEMQDQVSRKNEKLRQLRDVVKDLNLPKDNHIRERQMMSGERKTEQDHTTLVIHEKENHIFKGHCQNYSKRHELGKENTKVSALAEKYETGACHMQKTPEGKNSKKLHLKNQSKSTPRRKARSRSPVGITTRRNDFAPVIGKHRRSRSTDFWLNHKPADTLETDTLIQPAIKSKKTVKTPEMKDLKVIPNYILTHQEEDSSGEIETQLIKGEVHCTRGGGSSVQFTDIETLKKAYQEKIISPSTPKKEQTKTNKEVKTPKVSSRERGTKASKTKKRKSADGDTPDTEAVSSLCGAGIESTAGGEPGLRNYSNKKIKS